MNNDDILNIGDWVYEDGYGIVEKISPLYWDIYNHEIYQNEEDKKIDRILYPDKPAKELGNLRAVELQIKRFCNYKGVPIRRNRTVVRLKEYCCYIKAKDLRLIQKAQKNYPKEYESFLKLNKDVITYEGSEYIVDSQETAEYMPEFFRKYISEELPDKFTAVELSDLMEKHGCPFNLRNPYSRGGYYSGNKILVEFYYKIGDYREKHLLFCGLRIYGRFDHLTDDYGWIRRPDQRK